MPVVYDSGRAFDEDRPMQEQPVGDQRVSDLVAAQDPEGYRGLVLMEPDGTIIYDPRVTFAQLDAAGITRVVLARPPPLRPLEGFPDEVVLESVKYSTAGDLLRLRAADPWWRSFLDNTPETAARMLVGLLEQRVDVDRIRRWLPEHITSFIDDIPQTLLERGIGASELAAAGPPDHWLSRRMQRMARVRVVWQAAPRLSEPGNPRPGILSVCWSADGSQLFGGLADGSIRVWSGADGSELGRLGGHTGYVTSIAVSNDDSQLVSGSDDRTVRVWQRIAGDDDGPQQPMYKSVHVLQHGVVVNAVAVSHSGQLIASGDGRGRVRLYRADSGELVHTMERHRSGVYALDFTVDDRRLVSGGFDRTVREWDVDSGAEVRVMEGHTSLVFSVAVSSRWIISGSGDGTVRLFDIDSGELVRVMERHSDAIKRVAFVDDNTAVGISRDKTVRWWRLRDGALLHTFNTTYELYSCAVSNDGRIAIAGQLGTLGVLEWKK